MPLDNNGQDRIDFIWGNMPLKRNYSYQDDWEFRNNWLLYPGDGEAEYFIKGHNNNEAPSLYLDGGDNHELALLGWKGFPDIINDGETRGTFTVNWWDTVPAYEFPNIIGKKVDEAVRDLAACGVDPAILVDLKFDAENPYDGYGGPLLNAPGADNPGVIVWRYYEPGTQIGQHWDGSPWYAEESENVVFETSQWVGELTAVGSYAPNDFSGWHSFAVIQTKDPNKNSWQWWN